MVRNGANVAKLSQKEQYRVEQSPAESKGDIWSQKGAKWSHLKPLRDIGRQREPK